MNNLQIFKNRNFGEVRVLEQNGEPWFVAKDVCMILEHTNPTVAIQSLDEDERAKLFLGRQGDANCVNESGLYALIVRSNKPEAKKFRKWVTSEVLPSIRKTGSYEVTKSQDDRLHIMEMNARSRMAQTYLKLANVDTLSKTYKTVLVSKASEVLAGEPILPLLASKQVNVYSAKEIGDMFEISANMVGRIANKHNLKVSKYGEYRRDKSQHSAKEVDTWVYFDTVIPEIKQILSIEVA